MAKIIRTSTSNSETQGIHTDTLRVEYERQRALFEAQISIVQRFLEAQGRQIAEAFIEDAHSVRFSLPDRIICEVKENTKPVPIPQKMRDQSIGKFIDQLTGKYVHNALKQRLAELEQSTERGVAVCAGLIRYAAAQHITHNMLPAGRTVTYVAAQGEEIPTIPVREKFEPDSAIMAKTDAVVEDNKPEDGRGLLQVPYVPAARRFYLPQWVAFDDKGRLLVQSVREAEAHVASMQRFLNVLHSAHSIAPYMLADDEYHAKRYGMLGQLINQGRALARYQTIQIIQTVKDRSTKQTLNRGLSLSLPYFEDQDLVMKLHRFMVIPAGRIMFVPAFVVHAAREEQAKVTQDTRFNPSTRKHLLEGLRTLEDAFYKPDMA